MAAGHLFDTFGTFTPAFWGIAALIVLAALRLIKAL
jgi:hypothetical protein